MVTFADRSHALGLIPRPLRVLLLDSRPLAGPVRLAELLRGHTFEPLLPDRRQSACPSSTRGQSWHRPAKSRARSSSRPVPVGQTHRRLAVELEHIEHDQRHGHLPVALQEPPADAVE